MQPQKMVAFAFELYHITWSFSKDSHIQLTVCLGVVFFCIIHFSIPF